MDDKLSWILKYNEEHNNEYKDFSDSWQYLMVRRPDHHKANHDGYVYIHQLQAEKKLGRKLKAGECVHHIDRNKCNNDLDNLMVFKTSSDHASFHRGCEIYLEGDVWVAIHENNFCCICNKPIRGKHVKMCKDCYSKQKSEHLPSKEILTDLILNYPMLRVGKMYGVSDNAVRKWCRKYDLPFTRKGISNLKDKMNQNASA